MKFRSEARTGGSLNHSDLVTLFDVGSKEGRPYLVMEMLEQEVCLYDRNVIPANVVRWNPLTGARPSLFQIAPSDHSGVWGIRNLTITPLRSCLCIQCKPEVIGP